MEAHSPRNSQHFEYTCPGHQLPPRGVLKTSNGWATLSFILGEKKTNKQTDKPQLHQGPTVPPFNFSRGEKKSSFFFHTKCKKQTFRGYYKAHGR